MKSTVCKAEGKKHTFLELKGVILLRTLTIITSFIPLSFRLIRLLALRGSRNKLMKASPVRRTQNEMDRFSNSVQYRRTDRRAWSVMDWWQPLMSSRVRRLPMLLKILNKTKRLQLQKASPCLQLFPSPTPLSLSTRKQKVLNKMNSNTALSRK